MTSKLHRARSLIPKRVISLWSQFTVGIFGRGAFSFLVAIAGINVSSFLFHVIISRLLGPSHYGVMGALLSLLSVLAVPIGAAQIAVTQAVIDKEDKGQHYSLGQVTKRAFFGGTIAMVGLAGLAPVIDGFLHISSPWPLFLVGVWIPLASVSAVLQGGLIGEYRFRPVAFASFAGTGLVRLVLGTAMVASGFGVIGAVAATIFAQTFTLGSLLFSSRRELFGRARASSIRTQTRDMSLSIAALAGYTALIGLDTFLARHFFSPAVAGRYAAGAVAAHIAFFLPSALVTIVFPHLADGEGTSHHSRKVFTQALKLTTIMGVAAALALTLFSGLAVRLLFGTKYLGAIPIVGYLSFESAMIGILILFVYFHLARRSLFALAPFVGVILAVALISLDHRSIASVAIIMFMVSLCTMVVGGLPALVVLARASAQDYGGKYVFERELQPADLDLTLVVPFYNPGTRLGKHIVEVMNVLSSSGFAYEVLAVSDGSTDLSEEQLARISSVHLTVVRLDTKEGKGSALRAGLSIGRGEYLGFIDGDGDIPADSLYEFLDIIRREQPDIAFGSKRHSQSQVVYPPLRRIYSWGYQQLSRILFGLPIRDTQTGVKFIRRDVLSAALPLMVEKRFAFDLELFVVARQQGFRNFIEVPIKIGQRFTSTVSVTAVRNMVQDTLAIFYRLRVLRYYDRDLEKNPHMSILSESIEGNGSQRIITEMVSGLKIDRDLCRILILNWRDLAHPMAGGAEVYTHNVAREWAHAGHEVTLFCAAVEGRPQLQDVDGVHIIRRGTRFSVYRQARSFYRREGQGDFDLVIDEVNTRPFFAHKWAKDVPTIVLIHQVCREIWFYQVPFPLALLGRYWLEPRWLRGVRDVQAVTVSESSKQSLEQYGLKRVAIVPEGHFPWDNRRNVRREQRPTIVFVGRLEAHKRPDEAIKAFALLKKTVPEAVMWVIGSGPMENELQRSAPEGVIFLGKLSVDKKMERLARAHVIVLTSVREGWGLVVSEAAQVGTPSVAYDVPGLRDSVRASHGTLTPTDPRQLSLAIEETLARTAGYGWPEKSNGGTVTWSEVAENILDTARLTTESMARPGSERRECP